MKAEGYYGWKVIITTRMSILVWIAKHTIKIIPYLKKTLTKNYTENVIYFHLFSMTGPINKKYIHFDNLKKMAADMSNVTM